jgi:hypothetical protein
MNNQLHDRCIIILEKACELAVALGTFIERVLVIKSLSLSITQRQLLINWTTKLLAIRGNIIQIVGQAMSFL